MKNILDLSNKLLWTLAPKKWNYWKASYFLNGLLSLSFILLYSALCVSLFFLNSNILLAFLYAGTILFILSVINLADSLFGFIDNFKDT